MEEDGFLFEIQRLAHELDEAIERYGVRDRAITLMVGGLIDETEDYSRVKAIYSYNINSKDELNSIIDFVQNTWEDPDDDIDLDDLLDGTGIFLN